jgi:anti-sigma regulatory factor (Ser/Thr protein kinase)
MTTLDLSREPSPLELRARSHKGSVSEVRRKVAEYAEAGGANRGDVELAVAEAVGNAVAHGFEGRDDGAIIVRAEIKGARLMVEIADFGSGITMHARSPPRRLRSVDHRSCGRQRRDLDRQPGDPAGVGFPARGLEARVGLLRHGCAPAGASKPGPARLSMYGRAVMWPTRLSYLA